MDKVVYCNRLRWEELDKTFLEVEDTTFNVVTFETSFSIITPGPHTPMKQSTSLHAKPKSKLNHDWNGLWLAKKTDWKLQIIEYGHKCEVVDKNIFK